MRRYFTTAMAAHLRAGGSLYLLTVLGVALGVAAVLSIQIINRNAIAAFSGSVKAVSGEADLNVLGYTPSFPEELYPRVLSTPGVQAAWPLWRAAVLVSGADNVMLDLIGVDFFTPVDIPWQGEPTDPAIALSQPGWVALTPLLADQMGWRVGDAFTASWGSRRVRLTVGALVDFQALNPLASPKLAVMDIAQAQGLFGDTGAIHQIDVKLADGADTATTQACLQERLGPGVRAVTPEQRETQAKGLLAAFQLNLTALSLISLFVGVFLVYSSTQAALVRRREELGLLRSLGATRRQVFALIITEVGLLGGLGAALGLPLGYGVAQANVRVVSATLSNLYLLEEIARLEMTAWLYVLGIVIGVGGAVIGALLPALDVARRDTRALLSAFTLHETVGSLAPRLFALGAALPLSGCRLVRPARPPLAARRLRARRRAVAYLAAADAAVGAPTMRPGSGAGFRPRLQPEGARRAAADDLGGGGVAGGGSQHADRHYPDDRQLSPDPQRVDRHLDSGGRVHRPDLVARHRHRQRRRPGTARDGDHHVPPGGTGGRPPAALSRLYGSQAHHRFGCRDGPAAGRWPSAGAQPFPSFARRAAEPVRGGARAQWPFHRRDAGTQGRRLGWRRPGHPHP